MAIPSIKKVSGTAVSVRGADVDTDRIIPARFLKCVTFDDLAEGMFYDERFDAEGNSTNHPIDNPAHKGASIMVVGPNFGCGSSREHAPQSIRRSGFTAIVGVSYAEIFFGNSTGLGMPCVSASIEDNDKLATAIENDPTLEVTVDLEAMKVTYGDEQIDITMPDGAREALVNAKWDPIQELLDEESKISEVAAKLPYVK